LRSQRAVGDGVGSCFSGRGCSARCGENISQTAGHGAKDKEPMQDSSWQSTNVGNVSMENNEVQCINGPANCSGMKNGPILNVCMKSTRPMLCDDMEEEQIEIQTHGDSEVALLSTQMHGVREPQHAQPVGATASSRVRSLQVSDGHAETKDGDVGDSRRCDLYVGGKSVVKQVADNEENNTTAGGVLNMRKWKRRARTVLGTQAQMGGEEATAPKRKLSKTRLGLEDAVRGKRGKKSGPSQAQNEVVLAEAVEQPRQVQ
jgi:hypothetical protein